MLIQGPGETFMNLLIKISLVGICYSTIVMAQQSTSNLDNAKEYQFFSRSYFSALNTVKEVEGEIRAYENRKRYWQKKHEMYLRLVEKGAIDKASVEEAQEQANYYSLGKQIYENELKKEQAQLAIAKARMDNATTTGFSGDLEKFILKENKKIDYHSCQANFLEMEKNHFSLLTHVLSLKRLQHLKEQKAVSYAEILDQWIETNDSLEEYKVIQDKVKICLENYKIQPQTDKSEVVSKLVKLKFKFPFPKKINIL